MCEMTRNTENVHTSNVERNERKETRSSVEEDKMAHFWVVLIFGLRSTSIQRCQHLTIHVLLAQTQYASYV